MVLRRSAPKTRLWRVHPVADDCLAPAGQDVGKSVSKILSPDLFSFERILWRHEWELIAGVDEAGRGPIAGPVVAAAVIFPKDCSFIPVNDSKKLSADQRERLTFLIVQQALSVGVGVVPQAEIDRLNILQATCKAMRLALNKLKVLPDLVLVDGNRTIPGVAYPQFAVVKGDARSASIAAASIIAKVVRDQIMLLLDQQYPWFGFGQHKGYATKAHMDAISAYGLSPIHRITFLKPVLSQLQIPPEAGPVLRKLF